MDELLGKALTDLRNLSHSLDGDHIRRHGWTLSVQKLLDDLQKSGRYQTVIDIEKELPPLGTERPIILFRMIQECISNIIRHAGADIITFSAKKENDKIAIDIRDNGKGFDHNGKPVGVGLQNLKNRSRMIDADLRVNSSPGNGTQVTILVNPEKIV
jgi:signal transduction histidine kinase